MTTPTNHFVTLTIPDGKTIRGKVVYIQSKQERWRLQSAQVHIVCSEWLEPDWYPAVYSTGDTWFGGQRHGGQTIEIPVEFMEHVSIALGQ